MIGHLGSNKIKVNRIKNDNQGRILIVDTGIDEETFVLINLYNANTESEEIKNFNELDQLLSAFFLDSNKKSTTCRVFRFILGSKSGGIRWQTRFEKKSISKLLQKFEQNNLVGIWKIRNPHLK